MRKNTYRLGVNPSSFYLAQFDERELRADGTAKAVNMLVGRGDLGFWVTLPVEFGVARTDLIPVARSVLAQIVEMDDAARSCNTPEHDDDEVLNAITIREFFVEFEYYATAWNSNWHVYFTPDSDGRYRHRGMELPWMASWRRKVKPAILALDAAYGEAHSAAAGVYLPDWTATSAIAQFTKRIGAAPMQYEPGQFYKRELPVLMALLDEAPLPVSALVIDGYVWLSGDGRPGLGARLYEAIGRRVPVIGVAKTKFRDDAWSQPVRRGASEAPLYVTAAGIDRADAARCIERMSGAGRIPAILKQADGLARSVLAP